MKTKMAAAVLVMMAAWCATPAWAQFASIRGRVTEKDGSPVVGATIDLANTDNGRRFQLKTDDRGDYYSTTIPIGNYDLSVSKDGKLVQELKGVLLSAARHDQIVGNIYNFNLGAPMEGAAVTPASKEEEKQNAEIQAQNEKEKQMVGSLNETIKAAVAAEDKGDYPGAVKMLADATRKDATRDVLWAQLGHAYLGAGKQAQTAGDKATSSADLKEAVTAFQKAIEIKSSNAPYHSQLAQAYSRMGELKEATQEYETAAQLDPPSAAKQYFNLGAVLTNAGKTEEANAAFDKAIATDPKYAEAYYQKGVNLLATAKLDEKTGMAIASPEVSADLQKYLELAPNGPNAQAAKDLLTSLGEKVQTSYSTKPTKKKKSD
jgi:tetratricopeptide (TPR) repeat protein